MIHASRVRRVSVLVCTVMLIACSDHRERAVPRCPPSPDRSSPPLVIAHAGGEGLGPANTILAMQRSMAAGADVLDADLWMTSDGVIVAHHDRDLSTATDGTGFIDQHTWSELRLLDTRPGWKGDPIATRVPLASLREILDTFPGVRISVEIKQNSPSMAQPLCDVLHQTNSLSRVYVSSNDDATVYAAAAACPGMTMTTTDRDVAAMRAARSSGRPWCAPSPIGQPPYAPDRFSAADVQWSHDHGMAIYTWTVDDAATLEKLARAGVDGVYTRRPDIARAVFDKING